MLRASILPALVAASLFASAASAQVPDGTIAWVSNPQQTEFSLIDPATGQDTAYPLTNTTGTGLANTWSVLWDPTQQNALYVGGEGFLGRLTITGPGTSSYALISNQVGVSQMSVDANGQLVVIDSVTDQVVQVDPLSGAITPITSGPQPWSTDGARCGAVDPANGDIYVGTNKAMYVIRAGTTTPVLLSSGWTTGNFAFATGVAFSPVDGSMAVSILTVDRIVRMDKVTGAIVDLVAPHAIQSCNTLAFEANGDLVVGAWENKAWRIVAGSGVATPFAQVQNQGFLGIGIAARDSVCGGSAAAYGSGCPGTGGFTPVLAFEGCPKPGATVSVNLTEGLGGSTALLVIGLAQVSLPIGSGCSLLAAPIVAGPLALPLGGAAGAAGAGALAIPAVLPAAASGASFTLQAFVVDPANFLGVSASNGVAVVVE